MPPKKRASSSAKPRAKRSAVAAEPPTPPEPRCHYSSRKCVCSGDCTSLEGIDSGQRVLLCARHRHCCMCCEQVENGRFALGEHGVACMLPRDASDWVQDTCAFRCAGCDQVLLKQMLAIPYQRYSVEPDEKLFCDDCMTKCMLCEEYACCRQLSFGNHRRNVCADCVSEGVDAARVSISIVSDRGRF